MPKNKFMKSYIGMVKSDFWYIADINSSKYTLRVFYRNDN